MSASTDDTVARLSTYVAGRGMQLRRPLGSGIDGTVYSTDQATAVKGLISVGAYRRELDCYQRLQAHSVHEVRGHHVPQLGGPAVSVIGAAIVNRTLQEKRGMPLRRAASRSTALSRTSGRNRSLTLRGSEP
jgi:hypothetical protein